MLPSVFSQCAQSKKSADGKSGMLRILEIGAGTGSASKVALPILTEMEVKYSYTYTDISNVFFNKAKETFEPYLNNIQFKVLNIEEDPKSQGFSPDQFDLVVRIAQN
jgi:SAM-dependent methyltransferase